MLLQLRLLQLFWQLPSAGAQRYVLPHVLATLPDGCSGRALASLGGCLWASVCMTGLQCTHGLSVQCIFVVFIFSPCHCWAVLHWGNEGSVCLAMLCSGPVPY